MIDYVGRKIERCNCHGNEKGKTKDEVVGCGEGGHIGGKSEGSVCLKCMENPL